VLFGSGIYLNQKEKQKHKNGSRTVDTSNATPMPKESLVQFIRIVPSQQVVAGGKTTIDVWVKNFSQQPYENFAVKARFPNTVDIKDIALFFGSIPAGQAVKQSWTFVPKMQGWLGLEEPLLCLSTWVLNMPELWIRYGSRFNECCYMEALWSRKM
jgi:hypothetical protein